MMPGANGRRQKMYTRMLKDKTLPKKSTKTLTSRIGLGGGGGGGLSCFSWNIFMTLAKLPLVKLVND